MSRTDGASWLVGTNQFTNIGFKILQCAVPFTLLFWDGENPHIVQYFFLTSSQAAQHFGITELLFDGIFQH